MDDLEDAVHCALDNAKANGYDMGTRIPEDVVVVDLREYDADLEDRAANDIIPHVVSWQRAHS